MSRSNIMNIYGKFDVTFEKGIGCKLYDEKGNEYIDFVSGVAVNCLGHCHPAIVKTISQQSSKLMHISNYYWNKNNIELAEKLCEYSDHEQAFFCNSGTEAVEAAIKLSRKYGRSKGKNDKNVLIHMDNSFHGRTMGALSVTGREKYQKDFKPLIGGIKTAKFNDIEDLKLKIDENTCGVIIEPIQGEGGINIAESDYLRQVRELCDKYDAILIFDEVQCGMGRLGSLFAYKKFNVIPDVICMAKALGGGFPIGAILANKKAASVFVPGDHGSTFGGNPLASSVALTVIHELVDGGIVDKVDDLNKYFVSKLNILKRKYPVIKEIRGMGLLLGIAVDVEPKIIVNKCFENKFLVASAGTNVIRFLPPLNVKEKDIDIAIEIFEKVLIDI